MGERIIAWTQWVEKVVKTLVLAIAMVSEGIRYLILLVISIGDIFKEAVHCAS